MAKFSFSKKYNTEKIFNIDTKNFDYLSLEDLTNMNHEDGCEQVFVVRGIYINNKGLYEAAPVIALDDTYVNLPAHLTAVCQEMIKDPVVVAEMNAGHLGFRIEKYFKERYNKDCYSVEWVDILPDKKAPEPVKEPVSES
jgi:hypothetical protein